VERRLDRVEAVPDAPTAPEAELPATPAGGQALDAWRHELLGLAVAAGGRTLYADERSAELVAELQVAGADAYGLERTGDPFDTSLELRHGEILTHLGTVADGALACVLLAGCAERLNGPSFRALVAALGRALRAGGTLAVTAEAPWSWQARVGSTEADLAVGRPLSADTWLGQLHEAGFEATARHAEGGRTYLVTARRTA